MGTMPMKIPRNTAAAARPGSSFSFSNAVTNLCPYALNLRITWWPFHHWILSRSQKAKSQGPETDPHRVSYRPHLGARVAIVVDHMDGSVCNGAARACHLDQYLHLEFVAPASQFGIAKFV